VAAALELELEGRARHALADRLGAGTQRQDQAGHPDRRHDRGHVGIGRHRVEARFLELGIGADQEQAVVTGAGAHEVRLELLGVAPHLGPREHEEHWHPRALRDHLELDPAIALASDAIADHPPVASDRVDQVVGAGHHHAHESTAFPSVVGATGAASLAAGLRTSDRARSRLS